MHTVIRASHARIGGRLSNNPAVGEEGEGPAEGGWLRVLVGGWHTADAKLVVTAAVGSGSVSTQTEGKPAVGRFGPPPRDSVLIILLGTLVGSHPLYDACGINRPFSTMHH